MEMRRKIAMENAAKKKADAAGIEEGKADSGDEADEQEWNKETVFTRKEWLWERSRVTEMAPRDLREYKTCFKEDD